MKQNSFFTKAATIVLVALFFLLPFSSWLVSATGRPSIGLFRDILVALLFILGLVNIFTGNIKFKFKSVVVVSLLYMVFGCLTFFWREASALQWLRGLRFTFVPILLLISLLQFDFSEKEKKTVHWTIVASSFLVVALAILEFFKVKIPLTTSLSGEGAIATLHAVGGELPRLESVLAGPNALGLYTLSTFGILLLLSRRQQGLILLVPFYFLILLLTYSRSSLVAFMMFVLILIFYAVQLKFGRKPAYASFATLAVLFLALAWFGYHSTSWNSLITHGASSTERVEQYRRIWDQRKEIGLLGRGMGTAGPSSQNRIDNGPNHWTENVYLDTFEEEGLMGLVLFLLVFGSLAFSLWKKASINFEGKIAYSLLLGYLVAGLFINFYTGQVGLYIMILLSDLILGDKRST